MRLKTEHLSYAYGKKKVLEDVSMQVDGKKFVGIIGPNGCGKSTFLKQLYRVLKPDRGVIYFNGQSIEDYPLNETAREMAVVSQHNYYEFDFSVLEIVLMGRTPYKKRMELDNEEDYTIAMRALEKVKMLELKDRSFNSLSGGEQQRVILARALTQEPEILILDEPTNHLDIKYQLEILELVKNLDIEVIAALHDLNLAANYCDEIIALSDGKIYIQGKPREVLNSRVIQALYGVNSQMIELNEGLFQIVFHI